jgi:hypothetical protein
MAQLSTQIQLLTQRLMAYAMQLGPTSGCSCHAGKRQGVILCLLKLWIIEPMQQRP